MQAPLPATAVTASQRELLSKVSFEDDRLPDMIALVIDVTAVTCQCHITLRTVLCVAIKSICVYLNIIIPIV